MLTSAQVDIGTILILNGKVMIVVSDGRKAPMNPFHTGKWELILRDYDPGTGERFGWHPMLEKDLLSSASLYSVANE